VKLHKLLTHVSIVSAFTLSPLAMAASFDKDQVTEIQKIVHEYLVSNPEVLVEASQALQKQEMSKIEEKAQSAIVANAKALFADTSNPVLGNPKGNITIIEFFDYQCPHCKDMGVVVEAAIKNNKDVRVVLKELPIFGATSKDATSAALAANLQGADQYQKFHKALLTAPNPLNKTRVMAVAKTVGLDVKKLEKDMQSDAIQKQIDENFKLAQALELVGTPSFVIGKWVVDGKDNTGKDALFVPGVVDEAGMQDLINQVKTQG
jgi:protein-disulfide isomerase